MNKITVVYPDEAEFKLHLAEYYATLQKALYDSSVLVNKDIIVESKKQKTGRTYYRKLPSGRIVRHTSANRSAGETTAQMTGAQNKARDFFIDKETGYIGVDSSINYAIKNEQIFGDLRKGLTRNFNKISDQFVIRLKGFFEESK
jgi:hypothetical protein